MKYVHHNAFRPVDKKKQVQQYPPPEVRHAEGVSQRAFYLLLQLYGRPGGGGILLIASIFFWQERGETTG